jgi:putative N6-adenine-specific DNA methylase
VSTPAEYFAVVARGAEPAAAAELHDLGATEIATDLGGVAFRADLAVVYRVHLWCRCISRVLRPLRDFAAVNPRMLYSQVRRVAWERWLKLDKTFAVQATVSRPEDLPISRDPLGWIRDHRFAGLKVKDAICDRMREELGARPNVDAKSPDSQVFAYFSDGRCRLSIDASGPALHERGYRDPAAAAPLRETLAATILSLADWTPDTPLLDPMCGSGTLPIEAAWISMRIAPGSSRKAFPFQLWPDFDKSVWDAERQAAWSAAKQNPESPIHANDADRYTMQIAHTQAGNAGVDDVIQWSCRLAEELPPPGDRPGLIVVNPPYGERLSRGDDISRLYAALGRWWQQKYRGWRIAFFSNVLSEPDPLGLKPIKAIRLFNGGIECRLRLYRIDPQS